ncbi:hypothetical protein MIND_01188800 [Mycena indigotica]|uniref:Uncharacterized protein n=1 Tax=Mycena indigotica TaxID=2126181 RepID=A0A8H6S5Q1_9AGAR|nr:uncharacterized protein MIND_01188800 [Mycena indigotica]KAF7292897.1 hypothetical protein MIND_01188800 [Mycena indigotica]
MSPRLLNNSEAEDYRHELCAGLRILEQAGFELPARVSLPSGRKQDLRLGWVLGEKQEAMIVEWATKNHCVLRDNDENIDRFRTVYFSGDRYARSLAIEGGVANVYTPQGAESLFWVDTNSVIPEDRYTARECKQIAKLLGFEGLPKWYPTMAYIDG